MKKLLIVFGCLIAAHSHAQSFAINTTGAPANSSAILDVSSTSKGVLVPRVSTAQRTAIAAPARGLMVYDSTLNQFAYYNGTAWQLVSTATNSWTVSSSNQYSSVSGNVGVGTTAPTDKLHVSGNLKVENGKMPFANTGNTVYIGNNAGAGDAMTASTGNIAVGTNALQTNTTSPGNTAIGFEALRNNTGNSNTAIGYNSLRSNVGANWNTAIGQSALITNTNGSSNTAVGGQSLLRNATGSNNVAIGLSALINNTSGINNIAIGVLAGANNSAGDGNIFIGKDAGANELGSNKLYIDNSNTGNPLIYGNFAADSLKVNGSLTVNNAYTLPTTAGTANQVLQTNGAGQANWVSATSLTITETDPQVSSAITNRVPKWNGTALTDGLITDNGINIGIGTTAPTAKLHVKGNTVIDSGRIEFNNTGNSIFIGKDAGLVDDRTVNENVFIGLRSGYESISGNSNVGVGASTLSFLISGSNNTAIGDGALQASLGSNNTALGHNAGGFSEFGSNNVFIGFSAGAFETGNNKLYIDNSNTSNPLIYGDFSTNVLTVNGNLGIGTTNPTQAKLVVNGSNANTFISYGYLSRTTVGNTSASTTADYSIYASDRIAAAEFNAFSDARIKNIKGVSNNRDDLQTLMGIEITDYQLKDSIGKGNHPYKKVIAQQVEKVYPQAVSRLTDVVPDIYRQAEIKSGAINLATSLQVGDKVKLIFDSGEEMATVTAASATSFTVNKNKTGKVFVFGREVTDFRSVDYEAIGMLHVSATQQLVKELQQQKELINQQQRQINQLIDAFKKLQQPPPVSSGGAL